jgi:hypothetical protein
VPSTNSCCPLDAVCGQHGLDLVPERLVDDRRVFAGIDVAIVEYLPAVKTVLELAVGAANTGRDRFWRSFAKSAGN